MCCVGVGLDDFCFFCFEVFESFGVSEVEVSLCCCYEVVEVVMVDDMGVGIVVGMEWVGENCCGGYL